MGINSQIQHVRFVSCYNLGLSEIKKRVGMQHSNFLFFLIDTSDIIRYSFGILYDFVYNIFIRIHSFLLKKHFSCFCLFSYFFQSESDIFW